MKIDFNKSDDGLVPVIIQNHLNNQVLMLGYMNEEAFAKTQELGKVTTPSVADLCVAKMQPTNTI